MPQITRQRARRNGKGRQRYHEKRRDYNALRRLQKSFRVPTETAIKRRLLKGMTNWQNSQWLRAGRSESLEVIREFATMAKPGCRFVFVEGAYQLAEDFA